MQRCLQKTYVNQLLACRSTGVLEPAEAYIENERVGTLYSKFHSC